MQRSIVAMLVSTHNNKKMFLRYPLLAKPSCTPTEIRHIQKFHKEVMYGSGTFSDLQKSLYQAFSIWDSPSTPYSRQGNSSRTSFTVGDSSRLSPRSFAASMYLSFFFRNLRLLSFPCPERQLVESQPFRACNPCKASLRSFSTVLAPISNIAAFLLVPYSRDKWAPTLLW